MYRVRPCSCYLSERFGVCILCSYYSYSYLYMTLLRQYSWRGYEGFRMTVISRARVAYWFKRPRPRALDPAWAEFTHACTWLWMLEGGEMELGTWVLRTGPAVTVNQAFYVRSLWTGFRTSVSGSKIGHCYSRDRLTADKQCLASALI